VRAPSWYADWRDEALDELTAKQARLRDDYGLGSFNRYDYDVDIGQLTFSDGGRPKVSADIQVVGTTGRKDWLWSWANDHWPAASVEDMQRVRQYGVEHGIEELTADFVVSEDLNGLGWHFSAVAARILDAVGAYRAPRDGEGAVFFTLRSIRFVS
jgi:hypothetical protein